MFVRYYTVFHASQIDGIPELEVSLDPLQPSVEHDPRLLDAIEKMGVKLTHDKACAYYVPSQDQIVLPSPGAFANASDYDMTLLHEMSHATGHESRLNRSINHRFGSPGYAKEELRASISSAMNARILGIAMDPGAIHEGDRDGLENEAAYIRSWINALPKVERKAELMAAISAAQKISDYVLSLTLPQQEEVTQAVEAVTASEATSGAVVDEPDGLPFRPKIHL
jgi:antirestriction protein ArdC